ncbi:tail fiber domain-containing protein [Costertonia aggregata]|uniref:Peptidase S74 domain-containing protein n=1 Tax=Costertonia aggregata TaxID=343403 RepID=A0A7H9ARJ8_9FLAO|nr:tail fiber domain-containing protein [Costertonia aggregata]QLG46060.1 hypothetical protein HYG79_12125 [Costertonia aggregata]
MSVLTSKTELSFVTDLDWFHVVDISDNTGSPQGTSKKIRRGNILLGYTGFDSRYYTETEVNNFFSGTVPIVGYNRADWDNALQPDGDGSQLTNLPQDWDGVLNGRNVQVTNFQELYLHGYYDGSDISATSDAPYINMLNNTLSKSIQLGVGQISLTIDGASIYTDDSIVANNFVGNGSNLTGVELLSNKGQANGYVPLNGFGLIDSQYLPDSLDEILEYADLASFPTTGETGKLYVALDTNYVYRWSGSTFIQVGGGQIPVDSVFGRTGVITAQSSDYSAFYLGLTDKATDSELLDGLNSTQFIRSDQSDAMNGTLTAQGLTFNQPLNFFQPTTHNDKILFIGGNGLGDRDWSNIFLYSGGVFRINDNDIWHAGNDGSNSGLDADLLDGLQGSQYLNTSSTAQTKSGLLNLDALRVKGASGRFRSVSDGTNVIEWGLDNGTRQSYLGNVSGQWKWQIESGDWYFTDGSANRVSIGRISGNISTVGNITSSDNILANGSSSDISVEARRDTLRFSRLSANGSGGALVLSDDSISATIIRGYGNSDFYSTITATNFILRSDERLKNSIEPYKSKPINVHWKTFVLDSDKTERVQLGAIAQELEKEHPEFVITSDKDEKSIAYIDLLIAKNAELESRIEKLESLILNQK